MIFKGQILDGTQNIHHDPYLNGKLLGTVDGKLYAVKDNLCTRSITTTSGSRFLKDYIPPFNATVVDRLSHLGAVLIGKTNLDEFGMGSANLTSHFGPCKSHLSPPIYEHNKDDSVEGSTDVWLVPGGSSGGSAVAVATGMCDFALGTDTGGSVRLPASFCGIVGLKPSYGRVSRYGLIPLASSLDTVGILSTSVDTCATVLDVIAGWDEKDSSTFQVPYHSCSHSVQSISSSSKVLNGKRFGIPKEFLTDDLNPDYIKLIDTVASFIKDRGGNVCTVSLPHTKSATPSYNILCAAEVSSNMAKFTGLPFGYCYSNEAKSCDELFAENRMEGLGPVVQHRIIAGTYFLTYRGRTYYDRALRVRRLIVEDFHRIFSDVDVLLTPTTISKAPLNTEIKRLGPVESCVYDQLTVPVSLAGLPAISLPLGVSHDGLPLGIQLVCNRFQEETLLRTAKSLEISCYLL
ncbi:glutamyl-tRNA(Gln) amidotransferase subunit A, mitochondrial-like isoform X2 [Dysidea avara]|uniref:glutamyl-tRNA(Gln) amidotransferase subunit A, mitochondrial-like isoform X2 n=1 Tax=Dysidea avara TaxID=196820 RepID=UPI003326A938